MIETDSSAQADARRGRVPMFDTVVLDVDGTLVDSNYHHTRAWQRAFASVGLVAPAWRIHRAIGMGGDRLVSHVTSDAVEDTCGDAIRSAWESEVNEVLHQIAPFAGASDLLRKLKERGLKVALATSGKPGHTEHALDVLGADDLIDHLATSADADRSKPSPDLLTIAREAVGGTAAVMIGDSVWDAKAAGRAGMRMVGLLCGGFGHDELAGAGSEQIYTDLGALSADLDGVFDADPRAVGT